jgi:hypothetical protein
MPFRHDGCGGFYRDGNFYYLKREERNQILKKDPNYPKIRNLEYEISLGKRTLRSQQQIVHQQAKLITNLVQVWTVLFVKSCF